MLIQRPSDRLMMLPGLGIQAIAALADGVTYLLRDEFTTDAAAPLASPRTCEPGPGTLTIVDTASSYSISGSKLVFVSAAAGGSVLSSSFSRVTGRATVCLLQNINNTTSRIGWGPNTTGSGMTSLASGAYFVQAFSINLFVPGSSQREYASVMQSNFYVHLSRDIGNPYRIEWVSTSDASARATGHQRHATNTSGNFDRLRVADLAGDWATDYGVCDVHATPGVSGTDYTGQANAIIDLAVTAPASLAGEAGVWFRKQDASNGYKMYFNSAGAFKVDRYVAGTPTNVVNVAGVITGSGTRTIRTIADGTALRFYTLSGTTWTQRGGTITDSSFSSQTTITPFVDGSWTGGGGSIGQLDSWPRTLSGAALAALNAV